MTHCCFVLVLLMGVLLFAGATYAQDDDRKWSLEYTGSVLLKPILTSNPAGLSTGGGGSGFNLKGELFLPNNWHVQAGYFRADVSYGDGERTMEGLQVGIKRYFLHPEYMIQPYVLGAGQVNWSRHTEYTNVVYSSYTRMQRTVNPRVSFVPGVGVDLYVFPSLAFVMEYTFNMGINSHTLLEVSPDGGVPYVMKDKGMFHNLSLGVKIAFPFEVRGEDIPFLFSGLLDILFPDYY